MRNGFILLFFLLSCFVVFAQPSDKSWVNYTNALLEEFSRRSVESVNKTFSNIDSAKVAEQAFFESVDQLPGVEKSASGLRYHIKEKGDVFDMNKEFCIQYKIYDVVGKMVDSTQVGTAHCYYMDELMDGMAEGVRLAGLRGRIVLWIPSSLSCGELCIEKNVAPFMPLFCEIETIFTIY